MAQRERIAGRQPLWLRLAVLFCALLVTSAGIAQAAHIHGQWLPHHAAQAGANASHAGVSGEDSCPLCVAMHSALPVTGFAPLADAPLCTTRFAALPRSTPETPWYFAAFSRPPPQTVLL
jgi:hypothetical protein